jgi:cytochrome b
MDRSEVPVWSRFVRGFHWLLVAGVTAAWITTEVGDDWHEPIGWAVAALIGLRLVWGVIGPDRAARFASFVHGPSRVWAYARAVLRSRAPRHLGHNPLGGWMVAALLLTLAAITLTGWLMTTDAFWGSEAMEDAHEALAQGLLGLVALHVLGVIFTGVHQRENLVAAMWHGRKRAPGPEDIEA